MKILKVIAMGLAALSASATLAAPLKLEPANPQPGGLKPGLGVKYALPDKQIKTLSQADEFLKKGKRGKPLAGLDYWDTEEGEPTLTSGKAWWVAADISGYVRFEAPGTYVLDFLTNDGLRMFIGGQRVMVWDQRTACEPTKSVEVEVPVAGWYPLRATYFQNQGTACLHMRAGAKGSKVDWVPDSAFGH